MANINLDITKITSNRFKAEDFRIITISEFNKESFILLYDVIYSQRNNNSTLPIIFINIETEKEVSDLTDESRWLFEMVTIIESSNYNCFTYTNKSLNMLGTILLSVGTAGLRIVSSKADGCINYISYHQDINYFSKNKRIIKILADHTDVKEPFEFFRLFIDNTNLQRYYTSEGLKHYSFIDNIVD